MSAVHIGHKPVRTINVIYFSAFFAAVRDLSTFV